MPASTAPVELVVGVWPSPEGAAVALRCLAGNGLADAATLVVDPAGRVHLTQARSLEARSAKVVGGLVAAGLGLLTAGSGWLRLGGAAITSLAAQARALGLADERLTALGESMTPNTSALVAEVDSTWAADVERALAAAGADVVTEPVNARVHDQLAACPGVAYRQGDVDGDVVAARTGYAGLLPDHRAAPQA